MMMIFSTRLMKNLCFILILFLLCLSACKQNLPPDIWKKEKMIEFLVDAQLLEAKVTTKNLPKQQNDSLYACYYEELFVYHNTTLEIWSKNMDYYKDKPEELDEIYKKVVSCLTILESTVQQNRPVQDTLMKHHSIKLRNLKTRE
jgi:hypothetical protein